MSRVRRSQARIGMKSHYRVPRDTNLDRLQLHTSHHDVRRVAGNVIQEIWYSSSSEGTWDMTNEVSADYPHNRDGASVAVHQRAINNKATTTRKR